jgi:hypothetical protein
MITAASSGLSDFMNLAGTVITLGGLAVTAIINETTNDPGFIPGGEAKRESVTAVILLSAVASTPTAGTTVTIRGRPLEIDNVAVDEISYTLSCSSEVK